MADWMRRRFKPAPGTYRDYAPLEIRKFIRYYQGRGLLSYLRQVMRPRQGDTPP